ncbi:polyphenol oxidase family protein [Spirochaeta africana]|uniref:polyphenol oxidase family protein n=1 Tax=Spirochaeta africana TaxID=46355 RepID=UPI00145E894B|nr:polyphenol oxidase family protein [Spirochaeta africana]
MDVQYRSLTTAAPAARLEFPAAFYLTLAAEGDMGPAGDDDHPVRAAVLQRLGIAPGECVLVQQQHTRQVVTLDDAQGSDCIADGIVVLGPGCAAVTVADCMPIGVYEHGSGFWAILHSGRRGTGILTTAIGEIRRRIASSGRFTVTFGPCIGTARYQVDSRTAGDFAREWGDRCVVETPGGTAIDLRAANLGIAEELGVETAYVYRDCTYEHPELGSYRAEGSGNFRRMLALIQKD